MIRKTFAIFAALACLFTAQAFALDTDYRPYMTIGGGASVLNEKDVTLAGVGYSLSSEVGFNGFVGYGLEYQAGRVEFTLGYLTTDLDEIKAATGGATTDLNGELDVATFLVSVYYDFNRDGAVSPYFGGGIGAAAVKLNDSILTDGEDNAFAYQFGLGLTFNMSENTKLDLGYRLLGYAEAELGSTTQESTALHSGNAALRFIF